MSNFFESPFHVVVFLIAVGLSAGLSSAQDLPQPPEIAEASSEGEAAIQTFSFPDGFKATLFAAEPQVANPVAFHADFQGRVFVCESFRQERGIEDNRNHPDWLNDDLAAQSVEDRIAYMRKHLGEKLSEYSIQDDRIRLLRDTNGDGKADQVSMFAEHFNRPEMGTGAGVLSYRNNVYFTCIPDLFLLRDENNDGVAESRDSMHTGFGVRFAFRGHDLHGLIIGPDRRLYFSIGDRGYNVSPEIHDAASGAVFRCELDGSNLEVFATGLRNPQELAFDDFGNLFTGDNNSDSGDKARWVYVVRGGDSGWRMYYQYLPDRGPFNREKIWHLYDAASTPAYIVPPVEHVGDGPSGLSYYPGTGLSDHFKSRFFFCDFRGSSAISGVRTFRNQPDGAFFKVVDMEKTIWQILATDVDFGPGGKVFVSDWVSGWEGVGKGRIYSFEDKDTQKTKRVRQTRELLGGKIATLPDASLIQLLSHQDRRVRQEAQFCLIDRKQFERLGEVAQSGKTLLARLHGIWGAGVLARQNSPQFRKPAQEMLRGLIDDKEVEVRVAAARLIGELRISELVGSIAEGLPNVPARVQYMCLMALNEIGSEVHLPQICKLTSKNANRDPIIRHGCIMALSGIAQRTPGCLQSLIDHEDRNVRLVTAVALRNNKSAQIAELLDDRDPGIMLEAARAVYDVPIPAGLAKLAQVASHLNPSSDDALVRRVIHANARCGNPGNADALANLVAKTGLSIERRKEALQLLRNWVRPNPIDGVLGDWRPSLPGNEQAAASAFDRVLEAAVGDAELVEEAIKTAIEMKLQRSIPILKQIALDAKRGSSVRATALQGLQQLESVELRSVFSELGRNFDQLTGKLLGTYCAVKAELDPVAVLADVDRILKERADDVIASQMAVSVLSKLPDDVSPGPILNLLNTLQAGNLPPMVHLEVVDVASKSSDARVEARLAEYRSYLESAQLPGGKYHDALYGGDSERGRKIFVGKAEVSCIRCHQINSVGGEVGPSLSEIGKNRDRIHILDSIALPNKVIADGYTQTVVLTDEGEQLTGIVKSRNDEVLQLIDADGNVVSILVESIDAERQGQSSMPTDLIDQLSMFELRDLVEYLATRVAVGEAETDFERPASHK